MAIKFNKLNELEEFAENRSQGRFGGFWSFILAILRSRYLFISVGFYILLLMILGGVAVSNYVITPPIFDGLEGKFLRRPTSEKALPPVSVKKAPKPLPDGDGVKNQPSIRRPLKGNLSDTAVKNILHNINASTPSIRPYTRSPIATTDIPIPKLVSESDFARSIELARYAHLKDIEKFREGWKINSGVPGRRGEGDTAGASPGDRNIGKPGEHHRITAQFTIFQAKYHEGDWNCNGPAGTNAWDQSALKNFMSQTRQWSRDRINAAVLPRVLDIGTDEIFTIKPPFIFLTGHKEFHFLDKEVQVLRDYVTLGGCIWADSALAGRHSRFDKAFRNEIKRVLPDREFEILKPEHELFNTYFANVKLPAGMNFYNEPAEIIRIDDEMVVLYTLNGYGHFWEARLNRDGNIDWNYVNFGTPGKPLWRAVHGPHLASPRMETATLYRNLSNESIREVYKFGINVLVCLLTQYDDKLKLIPRTPPLIEPRPRRQ